MKISNGDFFQTTVYEMMHSHWLQGKPFDTTSSLKPAIVPCQVSTKSAVNHTSFTKLAVKFIINLGF